MRAAKNNLKSTAAVVSRASSPVVEALEQRQLLAAAPWGFWPTQVHMDQVFAQYPWLNGGGNGVAVVDKGIDYLHPLLGGNPTAKTSSPRIVNVYDWNDNDTDPFPDTPEAEDPSTAHATGVAGILAMMPSDQVVDASGNIRHFQGILQNSKLYNLRTSAADSQGSIRDALQWVVDNRERFHITAVNLTDFIGTAAVTPAYATQVKALWDAGVFIATPVANDWKGDSKRGIPAKQPIGFPAKSPYVFGTGGVNIDNTAIRPETQRGAGLDLLGPAVNVDLPYYKPETDAHIFTKGLGNSWGTPHTTGTAVLIQQIDPTITPAEIMQILQDSGVFMADPDAATTGIPGYKALDMLAAIQLAYSRRDDAADSGAGNDTIGTATPVALDANGNGALAKRKLLIHDHDYYTFTVSKAGKYDVSATGGARLLDAGGQSLGTMGTAGLKGVTLAAGTYYVDAYNAGASLSGTYTVAIAAAGTDPGIPPATVGEDGTFNDMKYDGSDNLHFAWYDAASKTLKYAVRNPDKVWSGITTIDGGTDTGNFVSLALDGAGRPGVAYYDANNADLKYAHFNGSSWAVETVDSTNTVGYYPSLKYDASDNPVIAYYYKTGGDLRFASNDGTGWDVAAIDTLDDVGRYPSLALNPASGRWAVAYETTGGRGFKFAQKTKTAWSTTLVDENGAGGGFVSLAFDDNEQPAFSYYDAKNADLRLARFNGGAWGVQTIAAKNSQGLYSNLFFDGGAPVVYFFNKTNLSLNAARANGGGGWDYEPLASNGGRENRVAMMADGTETFSYFDEDTRSLLFGEV
jgi:hypothetical protein